MEEKTITLKRTIIDFLKYWLLPKGFQDILISLFYRSSHLNKNYSFLLDNKKIENIQNGERCFIIGNGPSLANQDLDKLKNEYTFAVSHFFMTEKFSDINPFGYVVADPALFEESTFAIDWLTKLNSKCTDQMLFFPISARKTIKKYKLFQDKNIYYLDMSGQFNEDLTKFDIDLTGIVPGAQTVIIMTIMVAAYIGFEKIYLIGCDSDWAKYPFAKGYLPHFYNDKNVRSKPEICPRQNWKYEDVLNAALIIFKSYRLLNEKLKQQGIKVYNATDGGFLDVFERVDYAKIFEK
ncbi:MAG: DUF115 domain-containing protein [Candidatus Methanoperedens sp.]|nr:DUF115 domain-containing protein [Candidatus Methanoperedens sp.]